MEDQYTPRQTDMKALKKSRILIIEDNAYVREAFELTLIKTGLNALVLVTAEEALKAVKKEAFDIIISDFQLPGMDGLEFFAKAREYTSKATKVLISAYGFDGITTDGKAAGVDYFFVKPFSIHQLLMRLNLNRSLATNDSSGG